MIDGTAWEQGETIATYDIGLVPVKDVENLEHRLRAMLYALWRVRGVHYKIVPVDAEEREKPGVRSQQPSRSEAVQERKGVQEGRQ